MIFLALDGIVGVRYDFSIGRRAGCSKMVL